MVIDVSRPSPRARMNLLGGDGNDDGPKPSRAKREPPSRWRTREAAQAALNKCYVTSSRVLIQRMPSTIAVAKNVSRLTMWLTAFAWIGRRELSRRAADSAA